MRAFIFVTKVLFCFVYSLFIAVQPPFIFKMNREQHTQSFTELYTTQRDLGSERDLSKTHLKSKNEFLFPSSRGPSPALLLTIQIFVIQNFDKKILYLIKTLHKGQKNLNSPGLNVGCSPVFFHSFEHFWRHLISRALVRLIAQLHFQFSFSLSLRLRVRNICNILWAGRLDESVRIQRVLHYKWGVGGEE